MMDTGGVFKVSLLGLGVRNAHPFFCLEIGMSGGCK